MDDESEPLEEVSIVYRPIVEDCIIPRENIFIKDIRLITEIPEYIRNRAINIYNLQLDSISFRDENRRALIALLLYYAYCDCSQHIDIYYLAELLGFEDLRKINKIRKKIVKIHSFHIPIYWSTPEDYLQEIGQRSGYDLRYLRVIVQQLRDAHPTFLEIPSREVAIGLIRHFEPEKDFEKIIEHIPLTKSVEAQRIHQKFVTRLWPAISHMS